MKRFFYILLMSAFSFSLNAMEINFANKKADLIIVTFNSDDFTVENNKFYFGSRNDAKSLWTSMRTFKIDSNNKLIEMQIGYVSQEGSNNKKLIKNILNHEPNIVIFKKANVSNGSELIDAEYTNQAKADLSTAIQKKGYLPSCLNIEMQRYATLLLKKKYWDFDTIKLNKFSSTTACAMLIKSKKSQKGFAFYSIYFPGNDLNHIYFYPKGNTENSFDTAEVYSFKKFMDDVRAYINKAQIQGEELINSLYTPWDSAGPVKKLALPGLSEGNAKSELDMHNFFIDLNYEKSYEKSTVGMIFTKPKNN